MGCAKVVSKKVAKYSFSPNDVAYQIASALSALNGDMPVGVDQVIVEPTEYAGRYLITIYDSPQAANAVIPLLDQYGSVPISIGELCPIGYRTNRSTQGMPLRQHGELIGGTTSGKSNLLHVMLMHALRCPDCFVWIGGVWKLYDFVFPYVEPFLGSEFPCPIDWIAHGHQDVVDMMAAFLDVSRYRLNLRYNQRDHLPCGIMVLDEITYIVKDKNTKAFHRGKMHNADSLLSDNVRGTAEADLWSWIATQHDTQFNLGDDGGTVGAQMMFKFIFSIGDYQSAGRVTNDFNLSLPTHPGECWARLSPTSPLHKLRIPYGQKPNKARLHNGPLLTDMAWTRRHIAHTLDPGSAAAAGDSYANRHGPLVTEAYIDYLRTEQTGSTESAPRSYATTVGPIGDGYSFSAEDLEAAEDEFNQMIRDQKGAVSTGTNGQSATAPSIAERLTLKSQVLDVVARSPEPIERADIVERLSAIGIAVRNANTITNICGNYCRSTPTQPSRMGATDDNPPKYYAV